MFTGIIGEVGLVRASRRRNGVIGLTIDAPKTAEGLGLGESVAVNGVCLSVVRNQGGALEFEMIPETQRLTSLGRVKAGHAVNLERSLTVTDRLNGHLVLGHVDGVGRISRRTMKAGQVGLEIRFERRLRRYLVPKGPIAVDGVSLTLGERLTSTTAWIFLIPETLHRTTLGGLHIGHHVNIEVDYFAKLIAQLHHHGS